jgi:hypothetical protein
MNKNGYDNKNKIYKYNIGNGIKKLKMIKDFLKIKLILNRY